MTAFHIVLAVLAAWCVLSAVVCLAVIMAASRYDREMERSQTRPPRAVPNGVRRTR